MEKKILGIDYGASKVGLAMGDSETRMAFPYATLPNDKKFLQKLAEIIEREKISKVIIGIPKYNNREMSIYPGEEIGELLKDKMKVEVEYQDETFTTLEAERNLKERGIKKIKRYDDQEAAKLVLQGWFDRRK